MGTALTRRGIVSAAPAAVVAATLPAFAAGHLDAELLALRPAWLKTRDEFDALLVRKGAVDKEIFRRSEPYPDFKTFQGSYDEYRATIDRITAARAEIEAELGSEEIDGLEETTCDANTAVVEQIEDIPARTLAGLAFKVEVSKNEEHGRKELIASIMADILTLANGGLNA